MVFKRGPSANVRRPVARATFVARQSIIMLAFLHRLKQACCPQSSSLELGAIASERAVRNMAALWRRIKTSRRGTSGFPKLSGFFQADFHAESPRVRRKHMIRRGRRISCDVATSSSGLHNFCEHRELVTSLQGEPGALLLQLNARAGHRS